MKPILELSKRIAEILDESARTNKPDKQFVNAVTNAILSLLDTVENLTQQDIFEATFQSALDQILSKYFGDYAAELLEDINAKTLQTIEANNAFYATQGIEIPINLRSTFFTTTDGAALGTALKEGLKNINENLRDATVNAFTEALLQGEINKNDLQTAIQQKAEASTFNARTQAQLAISASNQLYRNGIAETAMLTHYLYEGYTIAHTRPFCRIHVGKVYTADQILQMRNGMLEPVKIFKGGYRCKHSWVPVNPDWDTDYTPADGEVTEVNLTPNRSIKVVGNGEQIQRLERQITLETQGYDLFENADNDTGFVAEHKSWRAAYPTKRKDERAILDTERDTAGLLSKLGHEVLLKAGLENFRKGDIDIIFNGNYTDIKTTESTNPRRFEHLLSNSKNEEDVYQSDYYIIRVNVELDTETAKRALKKARLWNKRHPNISVHILYTLPELKLIKLDSDE
jgi:hypothetical protein